MADDSENVGGISIGASIDDTQVDAGLNAILSKIEAFAKRASAAATIQPGVGAAPGAGAAPRAAQPAQISFGAAARQGPTNQMALQRRINEELAKNGEQLVDGVVVQIDSAKKQTAQAVSRAVSGSGQAQQATSIAIGLDTSDFREQFSSFLAELKALTAQASKQATIKPQIDDDEVGAKATTKKSRRRNIRDRGIGTEADPSRIYTFDPEVYGEEDRRKEAKAAQQRQSLLTAHERRKVSTSDAEQKFLNSLAQPSSSVVTPEFERDLRELSYEAQARGGAGRTSSTFVQAPNRTPAQVAAFRAEEERRADQQAASRRTTAPRPAPALANAPGQAYQLPSERPRTGASRVRQRTEEDVDITTQQRIATQEAQAVAAGRTLRTQESSLGGFIAGRRDLIRAQADLSASNEKVRISQRRLLDPEVQRDPVARRHATEELTGSLNEQAKALERVRSFSTPFAAARNLAGIAIAGAAFGAGLKAIDVGIQTASRVLDPYFQQLTGFIGLTNDTTSALADQSREQQGNVKGAVAAKLAYSGLGSATSQAIGPIIEQRAQIEAGNKAITDQIALIRTSQNLQQQGAGAGLGSTTGGVLGTPLFGIPSTGEQIGGFLSGLGAAAQGPTRVGQEARQVPKLNAGGFLPSLPQPLTAPATAEQVAATAAAQVRFAEGLRYVNDQLVKGGDTSVQFAQATSALDTRIEQTARSFDAISPEMAKAIRANNLYADSIKSTDDALSSLKAINFAGTLPDISNIGRQALTQEQFRQRAAAASLDAIRSQQQYANPSIIAGAARQQQFALNTQQPAERALQNLAQPLLPVGTGIAANANEQERLAAGQKRSTELQADLNAQYREGQQVIADTYRPAIVQNFGAAAGAAFDSILGKITANGQEIASIQAGISNEQAAYQTAQYNFQLQIAKRTLSDIGGLTGKNFGAGESTLGILERENLALSRQGQLLQFNLSQRQINFQVALAGFQAPGVTPEERQARIAEAQTEASYAQKQLDIQRQMFGNQVQIVDISNLRQGADLARQIGLLLQGRQVTIDTQQAQERLSLLAQQQSILVSKAGTYLGTINNLTSVAFSQIAQLEGAAGKAMANIAVTILGQFGIFLSGINGYLNAVGSGMTGTENNPGKTKDDTYTGHAAGGVYNTMAPTRIGDGIMGEAQGETVAIIAHPRSLLASADTEGGGGSITITFGDTYVRDESDIDTLVRKVTQALGREASVKGLRGIG